ncbi:MAG: helix-turn-helix domain-containing protein [Verrucomicrobiae bacterium]|nr:helix-turn-helix domain-containing protein [Verrucomicrobiae bacterium]
MEKAGVAAYDPAVIMADQKDSIHWKPVWRTASPSSHQTAFGGTAFGTEYRRPAVMPSIHQHDEVEVNFLSEGTMVYQMAGSRILVPSRRLAVFWAAVPHRLVSLKRAGYCYWFSMPLSWLFHLRLPEWFMKSLFKGRLFIDQAPHSLDEEFLRQIHEDLRAATTEQTHIACLEMEARLRRFVLHEANRAQAFDRANLEKETRNSPALRGAHHVQRIAGHVALHYDQRLRIADIARAVDLHPNYAMNLFQKTCGISLLKYITLHRLFHAKQLLAGTDKKVIEVAAESGFGTLSSFYDAFQKSFQCSPKAYRKQLGNIPNEAALPPRRDDGSMLDARSASALRSYGETSARR